MRTTKQLYRRDRRISVRFRVVAESEGETIPGCWAKDLSAGGMLLTCPRAPLTGRGRSAHCERLESRRLQLTLHPAV